MKKKAQKLFGESGGKRKIKHNANAECNIEFKLKSLVNSLPTECRLLITFANSLDPDQARHNVGPDLDPNCLTFRWYSKKNFSKKLILKKSADNKIE